MPVAKKGNGLGRLHESITAGTAKTWDSVSRPSILYCNTGGVVVLTDQNETEVTWNVAQYYELPMEAFALSASTTADLIAVWE